MMLLTLGCLGKAFHLKLVAGTSSDEIEMFLNILKNVLLLSFFIAQCS